MPFSDKVRNREWHREFMRRKRRNVPTNRFFFIFERDNFRCQYCGLTPQEGIQLQVDHITPKCLGGGDTEDNLITACDKCNAAKRDRPLRREESIKDRITPKKYDKATGYEAD